MQTEVYSIKCFFKGAKKIQQAEIYQRLIKLVKKDGGGIYGGFWPHWSDLNAGFFMDLKFPLYFCCAEGENKPANFPEAVFPAKIIFVHIKMI